MAFAISGPADGNERPPATLERAILKAAVRTPTGDERYMLRYVDLNGDGPQEVVAHVIGKNICGSGGCVTVVLTPYGNDWRSIGRMTVSQIPIYALLTKRGRWRDLGITVGGGGVARGLVAVPFVKGKYAANPTVPPARPVRYADQTQLIGPNTAGFLPFRTLN